MRLWDHQPLLDTFGQIQEIRTYYDFVAVDNDRYTIDGALRQVMLSARELNSASLPNRTWVNERLTFTHGYGLTLGPVNQVTQRGAAGAVRPRPAAGDDRRTARSTSRASISASCRTTTSSSGPSTREFHYPRGDDNVVHAVRGHAAACRSARSWRKLLFALRFGAYQIVLSDDIGAESRILFNRNIRERVRDAGAVPRRSISDPYLVLADGRLFWIYDAYTTSAPLSVFDAGRRRGSTTSATR